MEHVRYSWSKKNIRELGTFFTSQGFNVIEPNLPKPEIRIGYMERIEVEGEKGKAFLDPYVARIICQEELTEKDSKLWRLIEDQYHHVCSIERAIIYPVIIVAIVVAVTFGYRV